MQLAICIAFVLALTACASPATDRLDSKGSPSADLTERTIQRRAVEAAIWGIPAVNYDLMLQALDRPLSQIDRPAPWPSRGLSR